MFIPHTPSDRTAMLAAIGVERIEDLFQDVPAQVRYPKLDLPPAFTEMEAVAELREISLLNESTQDLICFLGAGSYHHYIPAVVDSIIRRGEFFTAYTPYQPEISQGTLQAIFEYQSLIAGLTGMDVCNASHYDGATAVAEAVNMAYAVFRGKKNKVILSNALHPHYRATVKTYVQSGYIELIEQSCKESVEKTLSTNPDDLIPWVDEKTALVVVQYPDFFGRVFNLTKLASAVHEKGALLAVAVNPIALGLLKPPGEFGADIVTGEGQPLGIPLSFGGPYLGLFATRNDYVRKMAGRLVGQTVDKEGKRAYVLTLTAREQHIRREKATSNICTNQGLMALASVVYLSALGKHGLKKVAELNYHKAHYLASRIAQLPGFKVFTDKAFFNEFVVVSSISVEKVLGYLLDHGILGGYDLSKDYPNFGNAILMAVTEMNTKEEMDYLVEVLKIFIEEEAHFPTLK